MRGPIQSENDALSNSHIGSNSDIVSFSARAGLTSGQTRYSIPVEHVHHDSMHQPTTARTDDANKNPLNKVHASIKDRLQEMKRLFEEEDANRDPETGLPQTAREPRCLMDPLDSGRIALEQKL